MKTDDLKETPGIKEMIDVGMHPVTIEANALACFCVITSIQLASRHPEAKDNLPIYIAIQFAKGIQEQLKELPGGQAIFDILENGWDPENDVML